MDNQDEFRELEDALKSLPGKRLDRKSFNDIHRHLMDEADELDRRDRKASIMKKSLWGLSGAAALFLFVFLGMSMLNPMGFSNSSEEAKMDGKKESGGKVENHDADTAILQLDAIEDLLSLQGIQFEEIPGDPQNVFHKKLNGIFPTVLKLSKGELSIYVFRNEFEVDRGRSQFIEDTALMNIVGHEVFTAGNVLMFYVGGDEPTKQKIREGLEEKGWGP